MNLRNVICSQFYVIWADSFIWCNVMLCPSTLTRTTEKSKLHSSVHLCAAFIPLLWASLKGSCQQICRFTHFAQLRAWNRQKEWEKRKYTKEQVKRWEDKKQKKNRRARKKRRKKKKKSLNKWMLGRPVCVCVCVFGLSLACENEGR